MGTPLENFKRILEVPSFYLQEHQMITRIEQILSEIPDVRYHHDRFGNIYVTKGEAEFYPLMLAHIDTVHPIMDYTIEEVETPDGIMLRGRNLRNAPAGIGGDNKTGIYGCLEVLKSRPVLKVLFCIAEEIGCLGATLADASFFTNVGYAIELDAPSIDWVTYVCNGERLFEPTGAFWQAVQPILTEQCGHPIELGRHPFTDVWKIKSYYDFSCVNFSSGYHNMHSPNEYILVNQTYTAIQSAERIIETLGLQKYPFGVLSPHRQRLDVEYMEYRGLGRVIKFPVEEIEEKGA